MKKGKLVLLAVFTFSIAVLLSGCGFTNQSPNASFTASPTSGGAPLEVSFDASESSDPDGSIVSYSWVLGDGANETGETITHTYNSAGTYTVELTVIDNDGVTDEATETIEVVSPPEPPE